MKYLQRSKATQFEKWLSTFDHETKLLIILISTTNKYA